jgi:YspA, cpYpsA-related SLOG family
MRLENTTVLVCGSRDGPLSEVERRWPHQALDAFDRQQSIGHVIQGGAGGFDSLAYDWAKSRKRMCTTVWADWHRHGRAAGPMRNEKQLAFLLRITQPHERVVLAFPGGDGTEGMVRLARESSVPVWRCSLGGLQGFHWTAIA